LPSGRRINYHAKDLLLLFQPPLHFFLLIINRGAHAQFRIFLFSLLHADEMTHLLILASVRPRPDFQTQLENLGGFSGAR
jgi:hypothetical protein